MAEDIRRKFDKLYAKREVMMEDHRQSTKLLGKKEVRYNNALKARLILQEIAEQTQRNIEHKLSKRTTMALKSVFPDPYDFRVRFEQKRNKTECVLSVIKGGEEINPVDAVGGGVLDVMSLALRVAFWSLRKTRPIMFLDEPCKFVSANYRPAVGEMLQRMSKELGMQFVIVSHLEELFEYADNLVEIK